jgi:hypothetical protein
MPRAQWAPTNTDGSRDPSKIELARDHFSFS